MVLRHDAAQSDFYLVAALVLFSGLALRLLGGMLPSGLANPYVLGAGQIALLIGVPIWLQKARGLPIKDLVTGRSIHVLYGFMAVLPLAVVGLTMTANDGLTNPDTVVSIGLKTANWLAMAWTLTFMAERGQIIYGPDMYLTQIVVRRMVVIFFLPGILTGALLVFGSNEGSMVPLLIPVGAGAAWLFTDRVVALPNQVSRTVWYVIGAICFFIEINLLDVFFNLTRFLSNLITITPLVALAMISLAGVESQGSTRYAYGAALGLGLGQLLSRATIFGMI